MSSCTIPTRADGPDVEPVLGLAHPDPLGSGAPARFSDLTTLRVGGEIATYVEAETEAEIIDAIREADSGGAPFLMLGGGSNILASDEGFEGIVVRDMRRGITGGSDSACSGAMMTAPAGQPWDELVATSVHEEWMGMEALSGIPGTVGASPIQNVGAYGQETGDTLASIRVYDRLDQRTRMFAVGELELAYRDSKLKRSQREPDVGGGRIWGPTGRWVVLEATFQLRLASLSAPIRYAQLAEKLGVQLGERAPSRDVRAAVLELRRSKGMVLDPTDHDSWSAGSFFTNPIVDAARADALPEGAPRYPVTRPNSIAQIGGAPEVIEGLAKTSAAWLIEHAGFGKGYGKGPVTLSTKHTLALTNRGSATAADVRALRDEIVAGVEEAFGITLVMEPVTLTT